MIQFFSVALSVIFLLVYAKCNLASVFDDCFLIFLLVNYPAKSDISGLIEATGC